MGQAMSMRDALWKAAGYSCRQVFLLLMKFEIRMVKWLTKQLGPYHRRQLEFEKKLSQADFSGQ